METDEGEWHDGMQVGPGSQIWSTGRYDGEIADGEPNGRCAMKVSFAMGSPMAQAL
jgi:MORN repeat